MKTTYPTKSEKARAICHSRWESSKPPHKVDPCGGCPLYTPCVQQGKFGSGLEAFAKWIEGINSAAENILSA